MASDVRPLGSFDPTSRRRLQNGGVVVAGDGRRFVLSAGQVVVQNGATHKANHVRTRGIGQRPPVAAPVVQNRPVTQLPPTQQRPAAPQMTDAQFYQQAINDPELQLENTQADTELRNAEAENQFQQNSVRTRFQRMLRGMAEQQPLLQQDLTERSAARGMLFSGGRIEELGNINRQYAEGVANANEEQTGELNGLLQAMLSTRNNIQSRKSEALLGAVGRARARGRDLVPPSARPNPTPAPVRAPVAGGVTPLPRPVAPPVAAPRPAPVPLPRPVDRFANLPTRNPVTDASIAQLPRNRWTERQREYIRRYGLNTTGSINGRR